MNTDQYDSGNEAKINLLVELIKNQWDSIQRNMEYLLKHINENSKLYSQIYNDKENLFSNKESQDDLGFYNKINLISVQKLIKLKEKLHNCFSSKSIKFNSIFTSINNSISQIENFLHQKDQISEYSTSLNSNDAIKEIFLDNMRKGITSDQLENFEQRKKLKRIKEDIEVLDSLTQKNLKHVAHSLLMYQEYRLKIENPQDSAKIEKRMFKASLDLIFVANSMTYQDNKT